MNMSVIISFRIDDHVVARLDALARAEGTSRGAYLRDVVSNLVNPQAALNIARFNQVSEYSQAALAALVDKLLPGQQPHIVAMTAQRLEQFHDQK
jgi:predicted transcriptional regulator